MAACTITDELGAKWVNVKGRIDGMTAPEIQQHINDLILRGDRTLVANMEEVNYVSSAGLRIFLVSQKQLTTVGGTFILYKVSDQVLEVFRMSGLDRVFNILSTREEIEQALQSEIEPPSIHTKEIQGISMHYMKKETPPGTLRVIGSQDRLLHSQYTEKDVVPVRANDVQFGTGLATLGDNYEDYKNFFGEAVIINRNFFFYPAVKRPAVDFMLCSQEDSSLEYKFLHGFGFDGSYQYIASFESAEGFVELTHLVDALLDISDANLLGIVILAESSGLWGMHLKQIPTIENEMADGEDIFDSTHFSEWMNFPVDPVDVHNIVAGVGIVVKDKTLESPEIQDLFAKKNNYHLHAGVFSKEPLSKKIDQFEHELKRILTELEVSRVQHILGQTRFNSGMVGIIELKG
ncbi:MAG: STAS domain-containing protein [bacterium]